MAKQQARRKLPNETEQQQMNKALDRASPTDRARISYVLLDLGELGQYRANIPSNMVRRFCVDIVDGVLSKGNRCKDSDGGALAKNILARAFNLLQKQIQAGNERAAEMWDTDNTEPF